MAGSLHITGLPPVSNTDRRFEAISSVTGDAKVAKPFSEFLEAQIQEVNELHREADEKVAEVATGESGNLHEMMIALDKADVSFRMLAKVRQKAVEAYQEVMRMNV